MDSHSRQSQAEEVAEQAELPLFRPEAVASRERFLGEAVRLPHLNLMWLACSVLAIAVSTVAAIHFSHVDAIRFLRWLFQRS